MDTNKLLQILLLIEADEAELNTNEKINSIRNFIAQNNDAATSEAVQKLNELLHLAKQTRVARFATTELKLLEQLGVDKYFGMGLYDSLQEISNSYAFEISTKLKQFQNEHKDKYTVLTRLKNSMIDSGVMPYEQSSPEIAFSIPDTHADIKNVADYLSKFSQMLNSIQDGLKTEQVKSKASLSDIKISRLNKGSVEFFVSVAPELAKTTLEILSCLATVYLAVSEIRKGDSKRETAIKLSKDQQAKLDKVYDEIAQEHVDNFIETAPQLVAKNLTPELTSKIRTYMRLLLTWLPMGFHVEVVYEKSIEAIDSNSKSKAAQELESKTQSSLSKVARMYQLPIEQLKLPQPKEDGRK